MEELTACSASTIVRALASGECRAEEVMAACLARIDADNTTLNAICTVNPNALVEARAVDARIANSEPLRPLEGVPVVIKDNIETAGLLTTYGSKLHVDNVPGDDAILVDRLRSAGAIVIGKSNTPEFAADINTSNLVFGQTRNPWDVNVTPGGSSGGTAAAIAAGFAPIGIGTDLGGSIRIPAAFNGIVGLRPSPGRVPVYPQQFGWDTLVAHVQGPMARDVEDLGRVLSVIAGPDDRDPSTLPTTSIDYTAAAQGWGRVDGLRIAFAGDFDGLVPVETEVKELVHDAMSGLSALGVVVEDASFDATSIRDIQAGTRAFNLVGRYGAVYDQHRSVLTPPIVNQIEAALRMSVRDVTRAEELRTQYWHGVRELLERYDVIACPTVGAPAFRLDEALPKAINGKPINHFYDVILTTYIFSVTGLPSMSVPCGISNRGLPVGLQLVGRRQREEDILNLAAHYQRANPVYFQTPPPIDHGALKPVSDALSMPGVPVQSNR
ncbi:MAG: amidase [Pseudomonadota bacterium]